MDTGTIIAIIIFAVVSLIVIGLIFLLSRRKKPQNEFVLMPITPVNPDIKVESLSKDETTEVKEEVKEEVPDLTNDIPNVEEVKESEDLVQPTTIFDNKVEKINDPLKDFKNDVDLKQEEFIIDNATPIFEEPKDEEIVIKEPHALKEEVSEDEIIFKDIPVVEEKKEEVVQEPVVEQTPVVESTPIIDTTVQEVNQQPTVEYIEQPIQAFNQTPTENHDINTNFKVEDTRGYVGNKTEVLNVEEIKKAMGNKE